MTARPHLLALAAALANRHGPRHAILAVPDGADLASDLARSLGAGRVHANVARDAVPVILSSEDVDCWLSRETAWPAGSLARLQRHRRIDTLHADRKIGLLFLADATEAAAILRGANQTIARCCPAVMIGPGGTVGSSLLADELPGYAWVSVAGACGRIACALPHGEALPKLEPDAEPDDLTIDFDAGLTCAGLHSPEPGGRWSGAGPKIWIDVPRPLPGRWHLRLSVTDRGNAGAGFPILVDGLRYAPDDQSADAVCYGPLAIEDTGLALRIVLLAPRGVPDLRRGPRLIGLRISFATLHRDPGPDLRTPRRTRQSGLGLPA
jgi:hypothetical protein